MRDPALALGAPEAGSGTEAAPSKVWLITGCSRGFGRCWAEAALARGDRVAACARNDSSLAALKDAYGDSVLELTFDVTDRGACREAVAEAGRALGGLDVLVNNAGFCLYGAIEELGESQVRSQIETNLLGPLWLTQAVLPLFRERRAGHILQVSSVAGVLAFPGLGGYCASKWGLEGFSETLAREVADFGIRVTIIEPGGYDTGPDEGSSVYAEPLTVYASTSARMEQRRAVLPLGELAATAEAILAVVDAEDPPLRLFLGTMPFDLAKAGYAERLHGWEAWNAVSETAQGSASGA